MHTLRPFVFLACLAAYKAYELSPTLAEFYCTYSGVYTNRQQWEVHDENRSYIYLRVVAMEIPDLSELPVLYLEQAADGEIALMELGIITDAGDGIIYLQPVNFSGNTGHKQGTFDPRGLQSLSSNQVHGDNVCRNVYIRTKPLTFDLKWADCRHQDANGKHYISDATITCDAITAYIPKGFSEIHTQTPYLLNLEGSKLPLPNAPDGYTCTCNNTSN